MENKIKQAREAAGLSQQKMHELLGIPKRTIENWDSGNRKPSEWVERLVVEKLESLKQE